MSRPPSPPVPPFRGKPPSPPPRPPKGPARTALGDPKGRVQVKVRYYTRARLQRVCPLTVETSASLLGQTLIVRPSIPGAQVVPTEQKLEPGRKATFQMTPLARGWLNDARVDVEQPGHPAVQVPLKIKTTSQRTTWVLLLLTILLPLLLVYITQKDWGQLRGKVPLGAKAPPGETSETREGQPGEVLADRIDTALKEYLPAIPSYNDGDDPLRPKLADNINNLADQLNLGHIKGDQSLVGGLLGGAYQFLCTMDEGQLLIIAVAVPGLLTFLSWVSHWRRRAWAKRPLDLTPASLPEPPTATFPSALAPH